MRVSRSADSSTPRSGSAAHNSDVRAVEVVNEDIVEVFVGPGDEDWQTGEVRMLSFHPRKYECKEIRLTKSQAIGKTNPLPAVSQKHDDKLMESL